ncbi:MAG TPA: MetQ/NlpA family ABC transporter substrate-binding protein [Syntrophomonadaceae bacterium]|nr:MetQ/NlpA family ABC transporter substrate-binding protein [Syntrophomonadaceae bacterium]
MKRLLIVLLIITLGLFPLGCNQDKQSALPDKMITIGIMPDVDSVPFLIAEKNGYYAKQGVQVKIIPFKSAKDRDSALQSGQLDGVVSDMVAVIFANAGGINLRMCSRTDGTIELMTGKGSGITSVNGLKGRSVGLSSNTVMEYSLDRMLEANQVQPSEVSKVAIPQLPTRFEMLQGGRVDAAIMVQPFSSLALKDGGMVLTSTDILANKCVTIAFTAESLSDNPEEIKAVMRAYNDAVVYLQTEPTESYLDYIIQAMGFPAEVKDIIKMPQYHQAELPEKRIFDDVMTWMADRQLVKTIYNYDDLINGEVLR